MLFTSGAACHHDGSDGRRIRSAQQRRQHDPPSLLRQLLQNVTAIRNGADRDDHKPSLERVDMESSKLLIREYRQEDAGQEEKLGECKNLIWSDANGKLLQSCFEIEQQQAGNGQRCSSPEMPVADQSSYEESCETGHLCRYARGFSSGKLVPVGQQQESGDYQKANYQCQQLRARKKGDGITNQSDKRECADSSEGV